MRNQKYFKKLIDQKWGFTEGVMFNAVKTAE